MQEKTRLSANTKFDKADSISFLTTEYQQCFDHMRHYDGMQMALTTFVFTGFTAILSVGSALYKYLNGQAYRELALSIIFSAGFLMGLILLGLLVRNREYFVVVARQVNTIRNYVLTNSELNFIDYSHAYVNPSEPLYFSRWSSYTWLLVMVAFLNGMLGTGGSYLLLSSFAGPSSTANVGVASIIWGLALTALQVFGAIAVLRGKDNAGSK